MERMRKHTPGHPQHVTLAMVVVVGLCEETVFNKRPLGSYAVPTWRTGWPCCLVRALFPRCSARSLRLAQRTTAASYEPVGGQQRA